MGFAQEGGDPRDGGFQRRVLMRFGMGEASAEIAFQRVHPLAEADEADALPRGALAQRAHDALRSGDADHFARRAPRRAAPGVMPRVAPRFS